jgi:hypothetical protein
MYISSFIKENNESRKTTTREKKRKMDGATPVV